MSGGKRTGFHNFSKRAKRNVTVRLRELEPAYDRALRNMDIRKRLGVSRYIADRVLEQFGSKCGKVKVISGGEYQRLTEGGEIRQWMQENIKGRK